MGVFKRLVFLVYGLCATAAFVALGLSWYGPWSRYLESLMGTLWFYRAVAGATLVGVFGSLVMFLNGVFASRRSTVEVDLPDGSKIAVTQDAISSRVTSIVEADGSCIAEDVVIRAKKRRGGVHVFVRICPVTSLDVLEKGRELKAELARGLPTLCGNKLKSVRLEFTEPQTEEYHSSLEDSDSAHANNLVITELPAVGTEQDFASTQHGSHITGHNEHSSQSNRDSDQSVE